MSIPMRYETSYQWSGKGADGTMNIPGSTALPMGGPDVAGRYSPEHFLAAAAETCLANTFFVIAGLSRLEIEAYRSSTEGELEFTKGEGYRFKRILIRPVVTLAEDALARAQRALEKAHKACLIARSLNCPVEMEPKFQTK
jgi:organic hydroperoxide reductase OsmC/OhrA